MPDPADVCHICLGCVVDWLRLPLIPEDALFAIVHQKSLARKADRLAREIYRILARIGIKHVDRTLIEFAFKNRTDGMTSLHLLKCEMVDCVKELMGDWIVSELTDILEDNAIVKPGLVNEWIGHWIIALWDSLPDIHAEHTKQKPSTGGGPAMGMRSFTPAPRPVRKAPVPPLLKIPTIPTWHASSDKFPLDDPELSDLYW